MVATDAAARTTPPVPEECEHPAPVTGVMAHEFAPYPGARGPEGLRRTTMYYGPVVGGLPIDAWHCEDCGLLRLGYPDGRREERRLFPGPQPGLIAVASVVVPETIVGMQARVSGLSASPAMLAAAEAARAAEEERRRAAARRITLPDLGWATWATVTLLSLTALAVLLGGILAVYTYETPDALRPLFFTGLALFLAAVAVQLAAAAQRHFLPTTGLAPSPAVALRGKPQLDPATRFLVAMLVVVAAGILAAGILAVYTWETPDALRPLFFGVLAVFGVAVVVKVADVTWRHFAGRR